MRTADFEYALPAGLIAQEPAKRRDQSRLLVLERAGGGITHRSFGDLTEYFSAGDVLVLNDSRVIAARLFGRNARTKGRFEVFLVEEAGTNDWWVMMRPAKRASAGATIEILDKAGNPSGFQGGVREVNAEGHRRLQFSGPGNILAALDLLGQMPLPPYIERPAERAEDRERYQTVYARVDGSVAAPTAGLHFTPETLERIQARGARIAFVTLHVGLATFAPVKSERLEDRPMHEERYVLSAETAEAIRKAKESGHRVFAAGTTTLRVLESATEPGEGRTRLFVHPPYHFKTVDALVTNFHLPRSTLLMLVSAFAAPGETHGRDLILRAYEEAIAQGYRFFSYGDAMLIL